MRSTALLLVATFIVSVGRVDGYGYHQSFGRGVVRFFRNASVPTPPVSVPKYKENKEKCPIYGIPDDERLHAL